MSKTVLAFIVGVVLTSPATVLGGVIIAVGGFLAGLVVGVFFI